MATVMKLVSRASKLTGRGTHFYSLLNTWNQRRMMSSGSSVPEILVNVENSIRTITINREAKKNSINDAMYGSLTEAVKSADEDPSTNILVLTGKGEYYTAGNDIKDFQNVESVRRKAFRHFIHALIDCKKPVVVLVNGHAIGIGVTSLGLVDAVYSTDKATFVTPFSRIGICAEGCSSYTFPRIMGYAKASELLYFSKKISAQDALNWGLVSEIFPEAEFQEKAWTRLREMAQFPIKSLMASKELVRGKERNFLHDLNEKEADKLVELLLASRSQ